MRLASPFLHVAEALSPIFRPGFLTVRLFTRKQSVFIMAIRELFLTTNVVLTLLSALVASSLLSMLRASPCLHLVEYILELIVSLWPLLCAARCITCWITASFAALLFFAFPDPAHRFGRLPAFETNVATVVRASPCLHIVKSVLNLYDHHVVDNGGFATIMMLATLDPRSDLEAFPHLKQM